MNSANSLNFTIGISPDGLSLKRDMLFVKSALLYADSIILISPAAHTYYQLVNKSNFKDEKTLYELIQRVLPFAECADVRFYNNAKPIFDNFGDVLKTKFKYAPASLKIQVREGLRKFGSEISETLTNSLGKASCEEMIKLIGAKRIKLYDFKNNLSSPNDCVQEFFDLLKQSLEDSNNFPLFDDDSNDLIRSAVSDGVIEINGANEFNARQAGLAGNMLMSLPSFEYAEVDEILDIRKQLEKSLIRFRSKMLLYNDSIQSVPWDGDFKHECIILYQKEVAPSVVEIDELTKESSFIRNLGYKILTDESAMKTVTGLAISIAASGMLSAFSDIMSTENAMITGGGLYIISKIASAYKEYMERQNELQKKDMYFYYKAGKMINESVR